MKDLQEQIPKATLNVLSVAEDPSRLISANRIESNPRQAMIDRVENYRRRFRERYPKLSPDDERYILDVLFGPFNLDEMRRSKEENSGEVASKELKTHSAKIQHMLTHLVLFAGGPNASEEVSTKVVRQLAQYEALCASNFGREIALGKFFNGVKAEIGITKALLAGGFEVILPNYQPNSQEKSYEDSQVYKWDVAQGVDLVAVKGSDIFLIDAKGTRYLENPATKQALIDQNGKMLVRDRVDVIERQPYEWNTAGLVQTDGLDEIFAQHPRGKAHRLTIKVPTGPEYLSSTLPVSGERPARNVLRSYARLQNPLIVDIIIGLDKSRLSSLGKAVSTGGGYETKVA